MRECVSTCAVAMLMAFAGFSQADEWQRAMDAGARAELEGDYGRATAFYETATEAAEKLARSDARRMFAWNSLATMYDALGRYAAAEHAYRRGLHEAEDARGISSPEYALVLENLATLYLETGQPERAEKMARQALTFYASKEPNEGFRLAMARNCLAEILTNRHKFRESETLLNESVAFLEQNPKYASEAGVAVNNLAVVRFFEKDYAGTERLLLQALDLLERRMGPDHPMLIRTLSNLASLYKGRGRLEESGERLRRAMSIAERRLGVDHPIYGAVLASYADYLRRQGEKSQAKAIEAKSLQILKNSDRINGLGSVVDITALKEK